MKRSACVLVLALVAVFGGVMPAHAHGELEKADPEPNAHLKSAPSDVTMTFTEAPSNDSVITVTDGCDSSVVKQSVVDGNDFVAHLFTGQPGKWHATFRVISAEDGHLTKGAYSFEVAGKKDCSADGPPGKKSPGDHSGGGGPDATENTPDGGGDFPVVPVVIAAIALIVVGVVVRRVSAR